MFSISFTLVYRKKIKNPEKKKKNPDRVIC